ncbi:MAG: hypothetical protein ACWA6Y_02640 [Polaromonas sp.]
MTPRQPPPAPATLTGGRSQLTAWLLFGPPLLMAGLRWLLQQADDRVSATPAPALLPVATPSTMLELVWPALVGLAVLVALGLLVRRIGWRRFMPVLGVAWALFWLAACGALLQQHFNREGLVLQGADVAAILADSSSPAAPDAVDAATVAQARVVTAKFKPPSARSLGGTELVLQVAGLEVPQRLLLDDAKAASLKPGDALALQLAPGRFKGQFVVGWQALPPASLPPGATP